MTISAEAAALVWGKGSLGAEETSTCRGRGGGKARFMKSKRPISSAVGSSFDEIGGQTWVKRSLC